MLTAPSGAVNSFVKKDALELSKRCLSASVPFLALIERIQIPESFVVLKNFMPALEVVNLKHAFFLFCFQKSYVNRRLRLFRFMCEYFIKLICVGAVVCVCVPLLMKKMSVVTRNLIRFYLFAWFIVY